MTIRFLQQWNGYSPDQIVSGLGTTEEARMVSLGFATTDLDGPGSPEGELARIIASSSGGPMIIRQGGLSKIPLANQRIVATMGDSFVWNAYPNKCHIASVVIATGVATFTLTETGAVSGTFLANSDSVDIAGLPKALSAMNGTNIPITAINTGSNTFSIATTLADVASTNIKNGATATSRLQVKSTSASVFTALEWLLGNSICIPRGYRRGWGSAGYTKTGAGLLPFRAQCRQLISDAGALVPHEVWVQYGTNDAAGGVTLAAMQVEVLGGLNILKNGGVQKVRLGKIWPRTLMSWDAAKEAVALAFNAWLDTLASDFVKILDATSVLQDTSLPNFQPYWVTGSNEGVVKADGLHPSHRGGMVYAQHVYPDVAADFPQAYEYPVPFAGTSAVAVTDMSGTIPTGWVVVWKSHTNGTGTAVISTNAATGEITVTLNGPATDQIYLQSPTENVGTSYEAETIIKHQMTLDVVSAGARFRAPYMQIVDEAGTYDGFVYTNTSGSTDFMDPAPFSGFHMASPEYNTLPSSTSLRGIYIFMSAAAVGSPVVYKARGIVF